MSVAAAIDWNGRTGLAGRSSAEPAAFGVPVMVEVRGQRCFVAAGGHEGATKAARLADLGADVLVWAADEASLRPLGVRPGIQLVVGSFDASLIGGSRLAIVDTGDRHQNAEIAGAARRRGVLVNTVDNIPMCDWSAPAILRRGHLTISVSSGGEAPVLAVKVRDLIGEAIGAEYGELLALLAELRPAITGSGRPFGERRRFWYELLDGPAMQTTRNGDTAGAREALADRLADWLGTAVTARAELDAVRPPTDATDGTGGGEAGPLGLVSLVGAGPGDPELLTLKAARRLAEADAVVHDRLVDRRILALARPGTTLHDAGKRGHGEAVEQAETTELLVRLARAGQRVVRLKGGDPFVFGRGGEEASALAAAGIPFEIVPGVTAGIAGPAYAGIPVTDRRFSRSVAFVTGHELGFETGGQTPRAGAGGPDVDWTAIASIDTVVVFMAGRTASRIAQGLLAAGRPGATPVAVIRAATTDRQETSLLDLATLARIGIGEMDERPALLVVGDVVGLAPSLAWFEPVALVAAGTGIGARALAGVGAGAGRPDIPPLLLGPLPHSLAQLGPDPAAPSENQL